MSTPTTPPSKFNIVREIARLLKLGDQGKLDSFLTRVIKTINKEIAILKKNLDTNEFNHKQQLEEFDDRLQDAKEALDNAYLSINVDKIATNEAQTAYVDVYLENIDDKAEAVAKIEHLIETAKEMFAEEQKSLQDQIDSLEARVKKLSGE